MKHSTCNRNLAAMCIHIVIVALFVLTATTLVIPETARTAESENVASKIHITAKKLVSNQDERFATFSGDVHAVQGDTSIRSDTLIVYYRSGADFTAQNSADKEGLIQKIVADGNVTIDFEDRTAFSEKAVYTARNGHLVLTGNPARIESQGNYITGNEIMLDRNTGEISVVGGTDNRVEAVFESENGPEITNSP